MAKIRIDDLPEGQKIGKEELRRVFGGTYFFYSLSFPFDSRSGLSQKQMQFEPYMEELRNTKQMVTSRYEQRKRAVLSSGSTRGG